MGHKKPLILLLDCKGKRKVDKTQVLIVNKRSGEELNEELARELLYWYDEAKRDLPWRASRDPYAIWVSEIILQQTRVGQGIGYYIRFLSRFPNVKSLAEASEQEVLSIWQGLGYYSRAFNLHRAARMITGEFRGHFPEAANDWQKIPGVGAYTAAAVSSIAFGYPVAAVDGNVLRVLSRLTCEPEPVSESSARKRLSSGAESILSRERPGDFNQAMMELGALVCVPKRPKCGDCPVAPHCHAYRINQTHFYPVLSPKKAPTELSLWYLVWFNRNGVFLRQRGNRSIWRQMWEFQAIGEHEYRFLQQSRNGAKQPSSEIMTVAVRGRPVPALERILEHRLTHRLLRISLLPMDCGVGFTDKFLTFVTWKDIKDYPLPVVFSKYLKETELWEV